MDDFPRIALVGAPTAGKSDLAEALALVRKDHSVIDGYAQELASAANLALGPYATYVGNLLVASERLRQEVVLIRKQTPFITCGTLIETMTYASMVGTGQTDREAWARGQAFMPFLGVLFSDMWDYQHVFFLRTADTTNLNQRIDREIADTLAMFDVPHYELSPAAPEERVGWALSAIHEYEANEAEESDATAPVE